MTNDKTTKNLTYPFGKHHRSEIPSRSGKTLENIELDNVLAGTVSPDDLAIQRVTLEAQAQVATEAGYTEVAENLLRAAEMTNIPDDEILDMYEALRPGRSTYYQLLSLSQRISSQFDAELTGNYIREAADAYRDTGLLKMEDD
ncbi:diol dehydratase small subunit [Cohaesibacter gelatinilyticus]|uniref:Glycerol dehydratase, cobalamin-dependent, gamma subunit n=1 Tax=Cohaesibacter gelatinilyticus TaxID=372072 RepID=A0A285ND88_9HYPH|nr:diol dehydratase small subunit [Cohaesibacter gelatinilyticus]SNZ06863.1 glycerol dehydratase, cobalamin-dependent, gamma subunit [Cohaesibacter gelatinilyticus]